MALPTFLDFILHIDTHLSTIIQRYGHITYLFLFIIIFCETGLVFAPFLPGDSLLFATGALAAQHILNIWIILPLFAIASILGDSVNYYIGHHIGKRLSNNSKLVNPDHLKHTKQFYKKYGSKTIVLARFVPVVRTFAPFVAGIGEMNYPLFLTYNVLGGVLWVGLFIIGGYLFGNVQWVKDHFGIVLIGIIITSIIPAVIEFIRHRRARALSATEK